MAIIAPTSSAFKEELIPRLKEKAPKNRIPTKGQSSAPWDFGLFLTLSFAWVVVENENYNHSFFLV
jgi:hypothetical protein